MKKLIRCREVRLDLLSLLLHLRDVDAQFGSVNLVISLHEHLRALSSRDGFVGNWCLVGLLLYRFHLLS